MNGQARVLAERARTAARPPAGGGFPAPTALVASGKGGVGKTSLAASLAVATARRGRRVLLLDLDLGLANCCVLLGLTPRFTAADLIAGRATLEECLLAGPEGVAVLPASIGAPELAAAGDGQRATLLRALAPARGRVDLIVADAGAGASPAVVDFVLAADATLLVTTPEPTAYTDAYALTKIVCARDPAAVERMALVVNRVTSAVEGERVGDGLQALVSRFLGRTLGRLGDVPEDAGVARAVRRRELFLTRPARGPAGRAIEDLARRLVARLGPRGHA